MFAALEMLGTVLMWAVAGIFGTFLLMLVLYVAVQVITRAVLNEKEKFKYEEREEHEHEGSDQGTRKAP